MEKECDDVMRLSSIFLMYLLYVSPRKMSTSMQYNEVSIYEL